MGTLRAPQMRGGGVAHGPNGMRNWNTKLQRRVRRLGLQVALSAKAAEGRIVVVDSLHAGIEPKTQWLDNALDNLLGAQSPPREAARTASCAPRSRPPRSKARSPGRENAPAPAARFPRRTQTPNERPSTYPTCR